MSESHPSNALAEETSPYLLQHARNPVAWHPWNAAALALARRADKPILLSIGYSACHWCHVMAHESFEDPPTAKLMNELFVNIKVDREERPDLDKIYQSAHQLLVRRAGGWPLTMFLTPDDHTPFFGGTYFPNEPRFGMPAFKEVLARVAALYRERRGDIQSQNASLLKALHGLEADAPGADPITRQPLEAATDLLLRSLDTRHGGFGGAPKFPHPTNIEHLMRQHASASRETGERPLSAAAFTLRQMAHGGIYDQLGGGFCRYSVDEQWMIPHFEKMLYDNGPLLGLCAQMWQLTEEPLFRRVAHETAGWVMREMQSTQGGYYSSLDADSEGVEGKFYVWTPEEAKELLTDQEFRAVAARFGLDGPPNFEGEHWHLHVHRELAALAGELELSLSALETCLDSARAKLLATRAQRVWPGKDEKRLGSWNGLMIKGMAVAGRIFNDGRMLDSADRALAFVTRELWKDGRLRATYKAGRARFPAYLDDYACLADGVLALLQCRWRTQDFTFAVELAEAMLEHFEDHERGGFYFTADDHETLIHRPKPMADDAIPAGNGIAAHVLGRLGHLLGESRYLAAAERTLRAAWGELSEYPHAHTSLLFALDEALNPPQTIVLRGTGAELERWHMRCNAHYAPRRLTLAIPADGTPLPGLLAQREARGGMVAYVCEGHTCEAPITEFAALESALAATECARPAT